MMSRLSWIAAFIGRALRSGYSADPDSVFETAAKSYPEWREVDPETAADSAFGVLDATPIGRPV